MHPYHIPVLLNESIKAMNLKPGGIAVDCTLGGGSHSQAILEREPGVKLYSFDQDPDAVQHCRFLSEQYGDRFKIINDNFANLRTRLSLERVKKIDSILFDLGVSSHQIDTDVRGFSYMRDGRLDMRMNQSGELTAEIVVNDYSKEELVRIFRELGEERESSRIAAAICKYRQEQRLATTGELAEIIDRATMSKLKIKARTRIFQALRIFVNQELETLRTALKDAVNILNPEGRIVVITYNSLEDRITKKYFLYEQLSCVCPVSFPRCLCSKQQRLIINPDLTPAADDKDNNRARSARLRSATRI
ncbi:MAG: 16S rRNA (cytosine(1402)-N(4))-methyltransferase RsmH [Candidatus Cloacimonetes bacterium]|nr:16S rRNA (cytosine(1402)-N(4))-methyltransferase RsmH [Candidatus Cloacimonadota bacterium]